jgi:ceramide glucosyltransferase
MEAFWVLAAVAVLGMVTYGLQLLAVRATVQRGGRKNPWPPGGPEALYGGPADIKDGEGRTGHAPPVSILKPLKGLDDRLFDNLESFCLLEYPQYELIFSLQDANDPAHKVARMVMARHPERRISIVVARCEAGLNPKVNNLIPAYRAAQYEHILISDSNVAVEPSYLREIVGHMADPKVGLVCNIIRGVHGRSLGSHLENLHLNSFVMGSVCFLDRFLNMPCVVGKSMLMTRGDLEALGGLEAVKDVLAEDYVLGRRLHEQGRRIVLSPHMIDNVNEHWDLRRFFNRHTRWGKIRWKIGGPRYLSELLGNPVFLAWLPVLLLGPSVPTLSLAGAASLLKVLGDAYLGRTIRAQAKGWHYTLAPLKDLIIGILWFVPFLSSSVTWRGHRCRILSGSTLVPSRPRGGPSIPHKGVRPWPMASA